VQAAIVSFLGVLDLLRLAQVRLLLNGETMLRTQVSRSLLALVRNSPGAQKRLYLRLHGLAAASIASPQAFSTIAVTQENVNALAPQRCGQVDFQPGSQAEKWPGLLTQVVGGVVQLTRVHDSLQGSMPAEQASSWSATSDDAIICVKG
jgi:hypothetical protein